MNTLPDLVMSKIYQNLSDKKDKINLRIAFKRYTLNSQQGFMLISTGNSESIKSILTLGPNTSVDLDGFCYLNSIIKRYSALIKYGAYLHNSNLIPCMIRFRATKTPIFHRGSPLRDICHFSKTHDFGYHTLRYCHTATGIVLPITDQVIKGVNDHSEWRVHMLQGTWIGGTGTFSLQDLALSQDSSLEWCPEVKRYISNGKSTEEPKVIRDGSSIVISFEEINKSYNIADDNLKKIPHEIVASKLLQDTDTKLSVLGITGEDSELSPDFIDVTTKIVLELGTNQSNSLGSLENDFDGKIKKYSYILQPIKCCLYILIVGNNQIVTNLNLSQSVVDDLCARFRIGLNIQFQISDLLSDTTISLKDDENKRIAKAIFSEITEPTLAQTKDFNYDEIKFASSNASQDDFDHTSKVVLKCLKQSKVPTPISRDSVDSYIKTLRKSGTRLHKKRITNVPMILYTKNTEKEMPLMDAENSDMPAALKTLWIQGQSTLKRHTNFTDIVSNSIKGEYPEEKHIWKKESMFSCNFSFQEEVWLAERGVGAKALENNDQIKSIQSEKKLGFDPDVNTLDIQDFINTNLLENVIPTRIPEHIMKTIIKGKNVSSNNSPQESLHIFQKICGTKLINYFEMISEIFLELSINYKHWTKGNKYMIKETSSGIRIIMRNTGTHLFITFAFPRKQSIIIDTGRLGPYIYSSREWYFTDFSSYNEPTIEHFVKSGPYMAAIIGHLMSKFNLSKENTSDEKLSEAINFIALLFLNNKLDSEELITSQRYLFMKLFEDATQDPYSFVERFPEVLRSRLTAFILNKTINLMDHYSTSKILKIPKIEDNMTVYNYLNIRSLINGREISLEEKINEFYYGYSISKERARGSDRTFKILKKILKEEYSFRDSANKMFIRMTNDPIKFSTDDSLLRVVLHLFSTILKTKIGNDFKRLHLESFLHKLAQTSFLELSTLKASSRKHEKNINIPENLHSDRNELFNVLKEKNIDEASKRPKVLEALMAIISQYESETGKSIRHVMQLIPWALRELENKGHFDSDIFPKPQHGGDREIHVLEIKARLVQYGLELISKTYCEYFQSETLTHPETKSSFVANHYKSTSDQFKVNFTISKSADASKWCQRHHSSHFAAMLSSIVHPVLGNYCMRVLRLWSTKKISFPLQFVATLLKNEKTFSTNEIFNRFRSDFYNGSGVMTQRMGNKMEIKSGMMQGILHYTSSLYHTMIQEVCKIIIERLSTKLSLSLVCNIVQGSDDSSMLIGIEGSPTKDKISKAYILLRFKEEFSQYLSVYWNFCKSSIGTIDLVEYNSEWHVRNTIIKPTFRWVSACMELSLSEKFVNRYNMFYDVLSQCLEGGSTTLECSIIQLCQSWLHYMMLGLYNLGTGTAMAEMLMKCHDPNIGFFPYDYDMSCGIPGLDFCLYSLAYHGHYQPLLGEFDLYHNYDFEGSDKRVISTDLRSIKLRFGKLYLWKNLVDRLSLGTIESAIESINKDPTILFNPDPGWHESKPSIILKVFEPGVKESINNVSAVIRMMAASAFILDRPCLSYYIGDTLKKDCLLKLATDRILNDKRVKLEEEQLTSFFPLANEYNEFLKYIDSISKESVQFKQDFKRSRKVKIPVFNPGTTDHDVMGLCRRKWGLGGRIMLSKRQFETIWGETKLRYPFLKDSIQETVDQLKITVVELKNILESLTLKRRNIVVVDSPAKDSNLETSITRMYWPGIKIRATTEDGVREFTRLRSFLFSLGTYWLSQSRTETIAKRAILHCHSLNKSYKLIPNKFKKIKTIYDWTNGVDKVHLIEQIKSQKQSALGFFSQPQKYQKGKPVGPGYWIGQVVGIPCHIELFNEYVTQLKIQHLSDLKLLGKSLIQLLHEIKVIGGNDVISSNTWLSQGGKISTHYPLENFPIPIIVDETIRADIIPTLETLPWTFQMSGTTLRLAVTETNHGSPISYTILSDSIASRDWNPDLTISSPDHLLNHWNNGIPANMAEFEYHLASSIPETRWEFSRLIKSLENQSTQDEWNLFKFRIRGLSMFSKDDFSINENFDDNVLTVDQINKIDNLLDRMNKYIDLTQADLSWAEEVSSMEEILTSGVQLTDSTLESIKNLSENLKDLDKTDDFENYQDDYWRFMPKSNRFFNNLNMLCELQTGKGIKEMLSFIKSETSISISGTLGKILSLFSGKFVYFSGVTIQEDFDIVSNSSRQLDTILSEREIADIDSIEIQTSINQLLEVREQVSGLARHDIDAVISRKRKLLLLKASPIQQQGLEDIPYGETMIKIINFIFEKKKTKFYDYTVDVGLKLSLIKIELSETISKKYRNSEISIQEYTMMRESINRSCFSPYLIDVIQECYGISLNFKNILLTRVPEDLEIY